MAAPWEKYQQTAPAGPWSKYQSAPAPVAPAPVQSVPAQPEPSMQPGYTPRPPVYGADDVPIDQDAAHAPAAAPAPGYDPVRALTIGAQGVGRGAANLAGGLGSIPTALFNAGMWGVDKIGEAANLGETGVRADYLITPDKIADPISQLVESVGIDLYERDEMTDSEQMSHKINDYGTQAILGAAGLTNVASKAGNVAPTLRPFVDPYKKAAGATYAGDISASTGAAVADEFVEDSAYADNPLVRTLANLLGGVTGAVGTSVAGGALDAGVDTARNVVKGRVDPNAPQGSNATRAEMDTAARLAQGQPTNLSQTRSNLDDAYGPGGKFTDLAPSEKPTVGMAADDIGMAQGENVARNANPRRFLTSDSARRARAGEFVDESAPKGADGANAVNAGRARYADQSDALDEQLYRAQEDLAEATRTSAQNPEFESQNADLNAARSRQNEASAGLDAKFREEHKTATKVKNDLYDAVPGNTPGNAEKLFGALQDAEVAAGRAGSASNTNGLQQTLDTVKRVLIKGVDEETGELILHDLTYKDLRSLNSDLAVIKKEVIANGGDPRYMEQVKNGIQDQLRELNPEAATYYSDVFAPKFRTGKSAEFVKQLKTAKAGQGGESSATRPTEFAQKFLRTPEDANALNRSIDVNADPQTAADARDWMLGDLAGKGALTSDGKVRYDKFKQWDNANKDIIDQFPELRARVDEELARAKKGMELSDDLNRAAVEAKENLKTTRRDVSAKRRDLDAGPLAKANDANPSTMVKRIMGSGDPDAQIAEFKRQVGGDKKAMDGLKAGVRDWIKEQVEVTASNVGKGDSARLSASKLKKLFNKHEKTLSKIYTPEEMNALRRAHQLMEVEPKLDVKATAGSDTYSKFMAGEKDSSNQKWRMVEAALKAKYGVLKGGGVLRTFRTAIASLPQGSNTVQDLMYEMYLNPDLARHLLDRPLKDIDTPMWNKKLNQIIGLMAGARADDENSH